MNYDVIIIGGGPAGVSASLYTTRANIRTLIIHDNKSALHKTGEIQNFYGYYDGQNTMSGEKLYTTGIEQTKNVGTTVIESEIIDLSYDFEDKLFSVTASNKTQSSGNGKTVYISKALLFATGENKKDPKIVNFKDYLYKGISYCAVCDAFFYKKKTVAVLGSGEYALHEAEALTDIAGKVYVLCDGNKPETDFVRLEVIETKIERLYGENRIEGVIFSDGKTLEISGLFVAIGAAGSMEFAKKIGVEMDESGIVQYDTYKTSIAGLFLAGDNISVRKQIAEAVCHGMNAAFEIIKYIRTL